MVVTNQKSNALSYSAQGKARNIDAIVNLGALPKDDKKKDKEEDK